MQKIEPKLNVKSPYMIKSDLPPKFSDCFSAYCIRTVNATIVTIEIRTLEQESDYFY